MYENSIIHPKRITRINNNGAVETFTPGTIAVFDDFERSNKKLFKIIDNFNFLINHIEYFVNFIISKTEYSQPIIKTNITLTDFKKIYTLPYYCNNLDKFTNCIDHNTEYFKSTDIPKISLPVFDFICTFKDIFINNISHNKNNCNLLINFPIPIALNAQSSKDRIYGKYTYYMVR